jgi:hypothetical protein
LPVARWITLAESILQPPGAGRGATTAPPPAPAIANAPPVVMSASVTGKMITAEIHVPIDVITGTQDAFMRLEKALGVEEILP